MSGRTVDPIKQLLWKRLDQLDAVRRQIEEIRPLKKISMVTWFSEYGKLKEKECIIEQDIDAYRK